jgi:hypothetical protein
MDDLLQRVMYGPLEFACGRCTAMENYLILAYPTVKWLTKFFVAIAWKLP